MVQNEIQSEVGRRDSPTKICRMTITHFENQDDPNVRGSFDFADCHLFVSLESSYLENSALK